MNHTNKTHTRQEINQQKAYILGLSSYKHIFSGSKHRTGRITISPSFALVAPEISLLEDDKACRLYMDSLVKRDTLHNDLFPSRETLARENGYVNVSTSQRTIDKLIAGRFVYKIYRHMKTSIYRINPAFYDLELRKKLWHLIPSFRVFPLVLLAVLEKPLQNANALHIKYHDNITEEKPESSISIFFKNSGRVSCLTSPNKKLLKKELFMIAIRGDIHAITELPLTDAGKIKCMAYSPEVLTRTRKKYRFYQDVKNPAALFFKIAHNFAQDLGHKPDYDLVKRLQLEMGIEPFSVEVDQSALKVSQSQPAAAFRESPQREYPSFGRFLDCHSVCGGLLRDKSTCVFIKMAERNALAEEFKSMGHMQLPTKKRYEPQSIGQVLSSYVNRQDPPKTVTLTETFQDGQPLYQTEEEPDDIYNPGGSDSSSQTSYL